MQLMTPRKMTMAGQVTWIANGRPWTAPGKEAGQGEENSLQGDGHIRIVQGPSGTEIKWSVFAANWASLFYILDWTDTFPPPVTLKYFLVGWFEETVPTGADARNRIEAILAKSDVRLTQRTFVREADPAREDMPILLKSALRDRAVLPDYSIDCFLDETHGSFRVWRIGSETPIAKVYGFHPVSYPCINGLSYDHLVSQAYETVISTRQPHYDHVIAAMTTPDGSVVWFPYQRVILPHHMPDGRRGVSVVSQVAPVDIKLV
jgi:hypothetical protein